MRCSVCGEERRNITATKSAVSKYRFFCCGACSGYEPRWLLILVGRAQGVDAVKEIVSKGRYRGKEISMVELIG